MRFSINIISSLFILIFISACSSSSSGGGSTDDPGIIDFSATASTIEPGGSVELLFEFVGGTGVINNGVGEVTSGTTVSVSPTATTTYNLTVTSSDGSTSASSFVTITVAIVALDLLNLPDESLDQIFQSDQFDYTASVGFLAKSIQVKATAADTGSNITVNGSGIGNDGLSPLINLTEGADTEITIIVSQDTISKTYRLTISRASAASFAEQAMLTALNGEASDEFGFSVALSGDTLAVGAYMEESSSGALPNDNNAAKSGAVYIFTRISGIWTQQAYIKASNTETDDEFGYSVALYENTLAVGAHHEDSGSKGINSPPDELATWAGAVYVFTRTGTTWSEQAYIKASNTDDNDLFGTSVALYGDTLAVGAIGEGSSTTGVNSEPNNAASSSGAVYIYTRSDSNWTQQAYLKASNTGTSDRFGNSVSLFADTLAVGASYEDTFRGAAYVFTRSNTTWSEQAYLKASNPDIGDYFGTSVALSDDTLIIGAPFEQSNTSGVNATQNNNGTASGAVYIFTRSNNTWSLPVFIKAFNTGDNDQFGKSVALSGDILVVGATREDTGIGGIDQGWNDANRDFGAVYVYSRNGTTWSEQSFIKASTAVNRDFFGSSVSVAGDTIAVGVPVNNNNAGAVYIFE